MTSNGRRAAIAAIGTAVPGYELAQASFARWIADSFPDRPAIGRWFRSICANSGIETRYTCMPDFQEPARESRFSPARSAGDVPTTGERMAIYERESVPLGTAAGQRALGRYAESGGRTPSDVANSITHLVVVSCTGFFAPGLDMAIARRLGLRSDVERTLIGFMGCAAAFNGLRTANHIVKGDPDANVLVVCVEICSIHLQPQPGNNRENLISAALFADGASACLVTMPEPTGYGVFEIEDFYTGVKPETRKEMIWQIGNYGFVLNLSPRIPDHLTEHAPAAVGTLFDGDAPHFWAIHPGGRAIVDGLEKIFALDSTDVVSSRAVLRRVGNLSSATILFVLDDMWARMRTTEAGASPASGVAMAFGPGLVIEMARLRYVPPAG